MDYVQLGKSGLRASVAGLGGGSSSRFGLGPGGSKSAAIRLIHQAVDLGITLFDSSGAVGGTDAVLGEALRGKREKVIISTKVHLGPDWPGCAFSRSMNRLSARFSSETGFVMGARSLRKRVERALIDLKTDYIDLLFFQAVRPAQYTLVEKYLAEEVLRMKGDGVVRAVGISEAFTVDPDHRMISMAVAEPFVDVVMMGSGPDRRRSIESILPLISKHQIGVIAMFAARGGLRSPEDLIGWLQVNQNMERGVAEKLVCELMSRLRANGVPSLPAAAYSMARHTQGVDSVLIGTSKIDHLKEDVSTILSRVNCFNILEDIILK